MISAEQGLDTLLSRDRGEQGLDTLGERGRTTAIAMVDARQSEPQVLAAVCATAALLLSRA